MDIAELGLRIENGQFIQGAKQAETALQGLGKASEGTVSPLDRMTKKIEESRVKFDAWQRQIAQDRATASHVTQVNSLNVAHETAFRGMGRLTTSFERLASEMTGIHPIVGKVAVTLAELGAGGAVTLGVVAGAAAVAYAWNKLTEDGRRLREQTDKVIEGLIKQRREQLGETEAGRAGTVQDALTRLKQAREDLANARKASLTPIEDIAGGASFGGGGPAAIQKIKDALDAVRQAELLWGAAVTASRKEQWDATNQSVELEKGLAADRKRWADEETAASKRATDAWLADLKRRIDAWKNSPMFSTNFGAGVSAAIDARGPVNLGGPEVTPSGGAMLTHQQREAVSQLQFVLTGGIITPVQTFTEHTKKMSTAMQQATGAISNAIQAMTAKFGGTGIASSFGGGIGQAGASLLGGFGGSAIGQAIFQPIFAAIGAALGKVFDNLFGESSSVRAQARQVRLNFADMSATMEILRAKSQGLNTTLLEAIEANRKYYESVKAGIDAALPGTKNEQERTRLRAEADAFAAKEAQRIKENFALQQQQAKDDLQVRLLRAQGHNTEADALALKLQQQREYDEAVRAGADATTLAFLKTVQAAEVLKKVSDDLNTSVRNSPSGFKIESYITRYADPRPWGIGGPMSIPYSPGRPSGTAGGGGHSIDLRGATFQIKGGTGKELLADFMTELRKVQSVTVGGNAPLAEALDYA